MTSIKNMAASCLVAGSLLSVTSAQAEDHASQVEKALIILTSPSLQTQGMAMVLGNAMQAKGVNVDVLLCDTAGDLALTATTSQALKPKNVTPVQLMSKLQKNGGNVSVCALYLPNSGHTAQDLREGINVATPPEMAQMMTAEQVRVFNF
jgi:predicted peroxiredoxin